MQPSTTGSAVSSRARSLVRAVAVPAVYLSYAGFFRIVVGDRRRFFPTEDFAFLAPFEANWERLRDEFDAFEARRPDHPRWDQIDGPQTKLWTSVGHLAERVLKHPPQQTDTWRAVFFRSYTTDIPENRELAPFTAELLDQVPGLITAMYSVMGPHTRLPAHFGLFKGALRTHIPLHVPPGDLGAIRVGGQTHHWTEGQAVVFDDAYWHTAWNESDETRVVLLMYFERPMPKPWLQRLNRRLIDYLPTTPQHHEAVARITALSRAPADRLTS